ncbi:actin filament-associated protein 1-like 2 isoform X2 [Dicentrarchus labrax]|uniref:actin filament-associated protein 1-like 2 isoform X2 n=1 Tax=Dicentrarchus labrax TaxID=13489 RepID=UPI0021F56FCA|nr:actin filament-associated protein 1-like 2 isoform X2 [Dicentrarchus labrax]
MEKHKVLDQLLMELHRFLLILDKETLSGNATIQKGLLSDLLQSYRASNGADEEYIYMNKVIVSGKDKDEKDDGSDALVNGKAAKYVPVPQKSLPDLPPPRTGVVGREPFPLPVIPAPACIDTSESYYEEAQPYEETLNVYRFTSDCCSLDDGEAVSSSYESYDEEEVTRGKSPSAQHQWPSAEASIELMKDARICAFLWRKKWLGQWAKQLCVIKDHRLLCYKSSKEQTPLLDVSLLGCSVVYKEKQLKRKEHKLKIIPVGGEAIVLALQSKEQTEQWLRVIQEISPKPAENCDPQHSVSDSSRLICTKGELSERHSVASESGSSTDSHAETPENKDVKKKSGAGLKFSNLMNIGKKKPSSLESPEKCVDTSGYLNVLVNSQWRTCWCLIKNGQLWFYQDKGKNKVSQPAVNLGGCSVLPDPSPEHLYSFRIAMDGTQLATLEAKTSADMGHWLGLLLSQTGSKTDPEELTYDYVNADRISSIVSAAKTSLYLMERRYSEPNTYIDTPPSIPHNSDELYDDVASIADPEDAEDSGLPDTEDNNLQEHNETCTQDTKDSVGTEEDAENRVYLDLVPLRSFLHTSCGTKAPPAKETCRHSLVTVEDQKDPSSQLKEVISTDRTEPDSTPVLNGTSSTSATSKPEQELPPTLTPPQPQTQPVKTSSQSQETPKRTSLGIPQVFNSPGVQMHKGVTAAGLPHSPQPLRPKAYTIGCPGAVEGKLGKNRTEADMRRYIDERDRLEKEREEVRSSLSNLKKERRECKEGLSACQDPKQQASLEACLKQKEEACREAERHRVEVELRLVEVKESLKKVESGPFTLGTTLDSSLQDTPTPKAATLPAPQASLSSSSFQPSNSNVSADPASPVNSASALKSRPASIMATKGKVLQKAKEWEKKSTT